MPAATLICHPATPGSAVRGIEAEARVDGQQRLSLTYFVRGDIDRLRVPPQRASRRLDDLWRHTCFEAFLGGVGPQYLELNLAPSTEWAAYCFAAYRQGRALAELAAPPQIVTRREPQRLELGASLPLPPSAISESGLRRLALSVVIEEADGAISYWALAHPAARPDFHHPGSFALSL